jgi:hypothetical protein
MEKPKLATCPRELKGDQQVWIHVACVIEVAVQMWLLGFIESSLSSSKSRFPSIPVTSGPASPIKRAVKLTAQSLNISSTLSTISLVSSHYYPAYQPTLPSTRANQIAFCSAL